MKKSSGRLISFFSILVVFIGFYIYFQTPNEIKFLKNPLVFNDFKNEVKFPNHDLPKIILKQPKNRIVYQGLAIYSYGETVVYRVVYKLDKNIKLEKIFPMDKTEREFFLDILTKEEIENGFSPEIYIPETKKTESGTNIKIYKKGLDPFIRLNGSYNFKYIEIDHEGYASDFIIFDKKSKLLYFQIVRYFAFQ